MKATSTGFQRSTLPVVLPGNKKQGSLIVKITNGVAFTKKHVVTNSTELLLSLEFFAEQKLASAQFLPDILNTGAKFHSQSD